MDSKQRVEALKDRVKKAEQAKTVAETQKQNAEQQRDDIVQKMEAEGVTPETVGEEIAHLEKEQNENLDKIETLLPQV